MHGLTTPHPRARRSRAPRSESSFLSALPARLRYVSLLALALMAAAAAGLLAFALFAHETTEVGPAHVTVSAVPSLDGVTTIDVPPLGSIVARTHDAPVAVTASLEQVDVGGLQRLAVNGWPAARTVDALKAEVQRGATRAVGKGLMAALVAAAFVGWALRRSPRSTLAAGLLGLALPALLLGLTVREYRPDAFRSAEYTGVMKYAPGIISLVQGRADKIADLQASTAETVRELAAYYAKPQSFTGIGPLPNTVRVLDVSDLHLDPVGLKLESQMADAYGASFIVDTGDLDNFGTPIEAQLLARYLDTRYRRVFVAGNHESPEVVRAVSVLPNVRILDGSMTTIDGITVYGLADPMSRVEDWVPNEEAAETSAQAAADTLREAVGAGTPRPDIIATHEPIMARQFAGVAPLLLAGHTHTPDQQRWDSSWYLNPGTIGGVAFSRLYADPHIPHGAAILYYTESLPRKLIAIDRISVWGSNDQSSITRTVVDAKLVKKAEKTTATSGPAPLADKAAAAAKAMREATAEAAAAAAKRARAATGAAAATSAAATTRTAGTKRK